MYHFPAFERVRWLGVNREKNMANRLAEKNEHHFFRERCWFRMDYNAVFFSFFSANQIKNIVHSFKSYTTDLFVLFLIHLHFGLQTVFGLWLVFIQQVDQLVEIYLPIFVNIILFGSDRKNGRPFPMNFNINWAYQLKLITAVILIDV